VGVDVSNNDMQQLISGELAGLSPSNYGTGNKVNNLLIPAGPNNNGGVATFRDENVSLNGQFDQQDIQQ